MADDRPAPDLYADDFYAWTQVQAEALRRAAPRSSNVIEWARVAEEIADLGSAEKNSVKGHLLQIAIHLYKLRDSRARQPRPKWRAEVRLHRLKMQTRLTPSIRREVDAELDRIHKRAAEEAQHSIDDYERDVGVDRAHRWTLAELLGEADDPLAASDH